MVVGSFWIVHSLHLGIHHALPVRLLALESHDWILISLLSIRFRKAWRVQGHSVEELPFRAMFGVWGSWIGLILVVLVLIAQAYIAVAPVGASTSGAAAAKSFFEVYLALPVCIACYIIGYIWKRTTPQRAHEIDLDVCLYFSFALGYQADYI